MLRLLKGCVFSMPIGLTLVSLLAVRPIAADVIAYMDPDDCGKSSVDGIPWPKLHCKTQQSL